MLNRILVTGSRDWLMKDPIIRAFRDALSMYPPWDTPTLVHGGARGADDLASKLWAHKFGDEFVEAHVADWDKFGKFAGIKRNQEMVDLGADICLAFPLDNSKGTKHCMDAATKAGIKVLNYGYQ